MKNNPHRASKSEVRRQVRAARKFAKRQKSSAAGYCHAAVPAHMWETMCPKVAR